MKTILAGVLMLLATWANALVYDWSGDCDHWCTGKATARFLVSDDYVPGTLYQCGDELDCAIIAAVYNDNTWSYPYPHPEITGRGIFGGAESFMRIGMYNSTTYDVPFYSDVDGNWLVFNQDAHVWGDCCSRGTGGEFVLREQWSQVPEPSPIALILIAALPFFIGVTGHFSGSRSARR